MLAWRTAHPLVQKTTFEPQESRRWAQMQERFRHAGPRTNFANNEFFVQNLGVRNQTFCFQPPPKKNDSREQHSRTGHDDGTNKSRDENAYNGELVKEIPYERHLFRLRQRESTDPRHYIMDQEVNVARMCGSTEWSIL